MKAKHIVNIYNCLIIVLKYTSLLVSYNNNHTTLKFVFIIFSTWNGQYVSLAKPFSDIEVILLCPLSLLQIVYFVRCLYKYFDTL